MTTPYVTGTVSVTAGSAIVTGAVTGWQTAGLVAGVFGLDSANGNPIPVLSVDSDTQITLAKPWRGTTASGQAYWITYDTSAGQQTVSLMQKVVEYIARLDKPALAALASLVPAADKLPYFGAGGAGSLADFPAAARALLAGGILPNAQLPERLRSFVTLTTNADTITANGYNGITGDGSGIPYSGGAWLIHSHFWNDGNFAVQNAYNLFGIEGAFRRYKISGTWGAWFSAGAKAVGTVVQSGALSTGAIIERGSNANGEYTRFADGTQICRGLISVSLTIQAGDTGDAGGFTYAAAFSSKPSTSVSYDGSWNVSSLSTFAFASNSAVGQLLIRSIDTVSRSFVGSMHVISIGRWF